MKIKEKRIFLANANTKFEIWVKKERNELKITEFNNEFQHKHTYSHAYISITFLDDFKFYYQINNFPSSIELVISIGIMNINWKYFTLIVLPPQVFKVKKKQTNKHIIKILDVYFA